MPVKSLRPDDVERFMHDVAAGQDGSQGEDRATRSLDRTRRSWCRRSHKALSISDQEDIWKPAIAATWLMILTGWRRGEVLGLRWSEIDLPPRTARLAVSAKCIAIANSGFSGGAVRSTSGCFGDGGGEEVESIGPSVPLVRILREPRTLHAHDAEALSGWGLHHHPALQPVHNVRAQLLKARNFGRESLDSAALVIDALNLHNGFVRRGLQHPIIAATAPMVEVHGTAERFCPEAGRLVHVRSLTIDQEGAETRTVHVMPRGSVWTKLERRVVALRYLRGQKSAGMHP